MTRVRVRAGKVRRCGDCLFVMDSERVSIEAAQGVLDELARMSWPELMEAVSGDGKLGGLIYYVRAFIAERLGICRSCAEKRWSFCYERA